MNQLEKLFKMIDDFLDKKYDALTFSHEAPYFLCKNYDEIEKVNKKAAIYLNDELPDVCDIYERGDDPTELMNQIETMYKKVKMML